MVSARIRGYLRRFPAWMQIEGAAWRKQGRVDLVELGDDRVEGRVRTAGQNDVSIDDYERADDARFTCSCRRFASLAACGHVWAVLLEVDHVIAGLDAIEVAHHASAPAAAVVPTAAGRAPTRSARPGGPPRDDWRHRLRRIVPTADDDALHPVLEYYVDGADLSAGGMTVHVRARYAKKNGQLGAPRPTTLPRFVVERLPREDRTLLRLAERDRRVGRYSGYYGYEAPPTGDVRLTQGWPVAADSMAVVVPQLAATGRVFCGAPQVGTASRPLVFDTEPPFLFEVELEAATTAAPQRTRLLGCLRRGDQRVSLAHVAALPEHGFLLLGDRLVRVDCAGAESFANEIARRGPLEVPVAEAEELLGTLARFPGARRFLLPAIAQVPLVQPFGVLSLLLPEAQDAPVQATLQFDYEGTTVPAADDSPLVEGNGAVRRRSFAAERQIREHVLAAGVRAQQDGAFVCDRAQVPHITTALCAAGHRVLAQGRRLRSFRLGTGTVRSGIDWLEVAAAVKFDDHASTLPELLRRKVTPDGFVELGDGSFGVLPENWVRRLEALRLLGGEVDGEVLRLPTSQALLLDAMLEARDGQEFAVDRRFQQLRARLRAFRTIAEATEPSSFRGELRRYQRHGLGWLQFLRDFGLGGCLADDMGLGKTVQVLAHLLGEHGTRKRGSRPSLLVAPRSVLPNWLAEAARFAPQLRVLDFSQPDRWQAGKPHPGRGHDLVLTTYALARADAARFAEQGLRFHYAILDESQAAKNGDSQTSKAVRLVRSKHRLALTGTPVENHLGDLWSLFEFLNPGMLGRMAAFRGLFAKDLTSETMAQHRDLVQRALRPVLLRRTKAQVLTDLPPKVEQTLWCDLEPEQRRRYDDLRQHYRQRLLDGGEEIGNDARFVVLEALLRLRQAACHEGLLDPTRRAAPSAKLEVLLPRLEQLVAEGHKVLVFSQFTTFLDLVAPALRQRGIVSERLDGQTRDRAACVQRFQTDPACPVFLISLKAGGFGLNLTAADYVFVLDPWWNPAAEMQAIDRTHRIGQKRVVHAYRLVCRGTVEERVLELQSHKKALCEAILGNERSLLQDLTRGDLELLLG